MLLELYHAAKAGKLRAMYIWIATLLKKQRKKMVTNCLHLNRVA